MKKIFVILSIIIFSCGDVFNSGDSGGDPFFEGGTSQGGSLARFTIVGDYLYIVNDFSLIPVDISSLDNPVKQEQRDLGIGIETIFPYQGRLFIGSASAVFIFSLNDPSAPSLISTFEHATGCDPVVVRGNYAYVTLREGTSCNNFFELNTLEVVDISNINNPFQANVIQMQNPRGLGIGCNNKLFVCEGSGGFVQFDITNPREPVQDTVYTMHAANDVIVNDTLLIVTGTDGLYQYSCTSENLELLSVVPISL